MSCVETIGIKDNPLKELPSNFLSTFSALASLTLSQLHLSDLLDDLFGNLATLKLIDLSYNIELTELPNALQQLETIKELNLEGCSKLKTYESGFFHTVKVELLKMDGTAVAASESLDSFMRSCGLTKNYTNVTGFGIP